MLRAYDTNDPVYFGHHYKSKGGYNSGGDVFAFAMRNLSLPFSLSLTDTRALTHSHTLRALYYQVP